MADFQRAQDIIAYEAFSGLRNDVLPYRFSLSDLAIATNVDIDASGGITRRVGRTLARAGSAHSLWVADNECFFVEGGSLKQLGTDYSALVLRSGLSPTLPMSFQKINETIYFSNGVDTGVVDHGVARSWGLATPQLPGVSITVGNMPSGDYQFAATFLREDGQESGTGIAGRISVPEGSGLVFTMPISSDPTVMQKRIWVSTPNGDILYDAGVMAASATSYGYTNDTKELSFPLATQFMGPPPAGHLVGYYQGRAYVSVGDTLFYSEPYAYELFDLRNYLTCDSRITMFAPIEDRDNPGIFLGTEKTTGWLQGNDPTAFTLLNPVAYGTIPGTMVYVDGALYAQHGAGAHDLPMWLSAQGICIGLPGGAIQNITRAKYSFSPQGSGCALFKPEKKQAIFVANY